MVDIKSLLPELRKLVGELNEDLLDRCTTDATINSGLKETFQQIEKGGRTAQAFEVWREDYLDQVAVAWVLACVFVRFMEDNLLIDECWLAGEGPRRKLAEDTHELFFREHPHDTDREYFQHVFKEVGQIPAAKDLFAEGKTPLWAVAPSGDAAMKLLKFWREMNPEAGTLKRAFQVENGDTRFLGDLYQELSERAKKKFALLQTPVFVEEFILDRTLTPAIDEFGLEKVRMIDPTCGSGHFLLGGFARLFNLWSKPDHTTGNAEKDAQNALDGVWGVDINPFAVAIARFRLIVAAVQACSIKRLKKAPGWNIHLACGDSLLFGSKPSFGGVRTGLTQQLNLFEVSTIYATEDRKALQEILGQGYHVVVGNPPYITVKDKAQNEAYRRNFSQVCHRQYSLGVPFTQRFWELAIQKNEDGAKEAGHIGMITANSYMKREFGKKLIEDYFPKVDLTHIIDTSGAYIPGHGTPTVILIGRNQRPVGDRVRAVLGIKGEPSTPDNASEGQVWQSIVSQIDIANSQDEFTSTADVLRTTLAGHPWSIGGGGAVDLKEQLEGCDNRLGDFIDLLGLLFMTRADEVYLTDRATLRRYGVDDCHICSDVEGGAIRDWSVQAHDSVLYPYNSDRTPITDSNTSPVIRFLWPYRELLWARREPNGNHREIGLTWYEWSRFQKERLLSPLIIAYSKIASHNHFILGKGGKLFNCSSPIIKLSSNSTIDDHLALLGLVNSSTACFWMKQVSHQKQMTGGDGIRVASRAQVPYEFAGTQLDHLPVPETFRTGVLRDRILRLAKILDNAANEASGLTACRAIVEALGGGESRIREIFSSFLLERATLRSQMVFLQEEIDFTCYLMFGLTDGSLLCDEWEWPTVRLDVGMRPFEIFQQRNLDDFPVPSEIPTEWPEGLKAVWRKRIEAIRRTKDLSLIEDDHYKRRWVGRQGLFNHTARQDELMSACESWLLDRLETPKYRKGTKDHPEPTTTAQMADVASADAEFLQVAALYRGRPDFSVAALVSELIEGEAVPFLPILRYKPASLWKREVWEGTWDLQRQQDDGKDVGEIPVPPKYATADFLKTDFWRLRGKLDVPKERWISYPHCATDSDQTLVVGWAGWSHLEQATALIAYYDARKREGWDAKRLTPLLAGLDQLLPWIHQWHPERDKESGTTWGEEYNGLLATEAHQLGLTLDDVRNWTPPEKVKKTPKGRKKKIEAEGDE